MSKHTPGPWELCGISGRMVKPVAFYGGDGFIADVDTLANARLIAASPLLLAACKRLVEADIKQSEEAWGEDEIHPDALKLLTEAVDLARSAIHLAQSPAGATE